ncbi:MAG: hypothetical protein NW224_19250 [Leptolyngbyaceae cyanobacterium bins.302]|nr:hypothetical protein [Leptolyngbyaceae cyanobacterium bins.302]
MTRLLEAGLTVLLVSTLGMPAQANSEVQPATENQPTIAQPATVQTPQPKVEAKRVQDTRGNDTNTAKTAEVSERDRVQLEHYLQRPLPTGVVNEQVTGF